MTNQTIPTQRNHPYQVSFHVEHRPCFLVVAIRGEASFGQAEAISAELLRIPLDAYSLVVLDLADLTFISSLAMGTLVDYRRNLWRRGIEVRLANVQAQVWLALESAGLLGLFQPIDLDEQTRPPAMGVAEPGLLSRIVTALRWNRLQQRHHQRRERSDAVRPIL